MNRKPALPVDAILPGVLESLRTTPSLVIEAPPGAGKTTRVPPALLGLVPGEVIVLEPRRIAARLAARRVAWEMNEEAGETVGYQVRFEEKIGPRTRLRFVTEGILNRRFLTDPTLKGVDAVVLDEFHERHLDSDLALALLKRLQRTRPNLLIVVMSATLDAGPIAAYLGNCPVLRSEGRLYPLTIRHIPYSPEPLHIQVRKAVATLNAEGHTANILTFLPGSAEIRRAMRECESLPGLTVLPLHGDLTPAEQDRAVLPSALPGFRERKLILATNVAESSVTVQGVSAVIDSGLVRRATYSPWTGLPTLEIGRISKASATQRAGRAGRTGPGQVLRLYTENDLFLRPGHDTPEIARTDLSHLLLTLRAMKIAHLGDLDWLDAPPADAVASAESLLDRLGANAAMAERLARYPLPPRLSRIVVESLERGVGEDGCRAAALLGLGARSEKSDLLAALDLPPDPRLRQHIEQLLRMARPSKQDHHNDEALLLAILSGFPDRVAKRKAGKQVLLASGITAELAGEVPTYEFMVALDVEDRKENPMPLVRTTARIEPDWLLDLFSDRVEEQATIVWNRSNDRVERVSALVYEKLVLEETRGAASETEAADMLAAKALEVGIEQFVDRATLEHFTMRLEFAGFEPPDIAGTLRELCLGLQSFGDLKKASPNFMPLLEERSNARLLNEVAPLSIRLKNGRPTKVHYEQGRPPWIASRLQDFWGMRDTPKIGPDSIPLTVHLLGPNQRALQTTTDLAGFWDRLYPQLRPGLARKYPKHQWPEKKA
ncbi:ATP-dependent helicase C-terminal domain-containing protein [Granulicella pectinivorans]|uniref:ATP-dependent helicase C-terminal domain-containing protein n=1 Tax=Granulicella pectinivorans TaxID=474950 RepID=UPI001FEA7EB0|nr:ATP-dependent helicase C-terminal domain-containing protein [Granulicella pectinivorans]